MQARLRLRLSVCLPASSFSSARLSWACQCNCSVMRQASTSWHTASPSAQHGCWPLVQSSLPRSLKHGFSSAQSDFSRFSTCPRKVQVRYLPWSGGFCMARFIPRALPPASGPSLYSASVTCAGGVTPSNMRSRPPLYRMQSSMLLLSSFWHPAPDDSVGSFNQSHRIVPPHSSRGICRSRFVPRAAFVVAPGVIRALAGRISIAGLAVNVGVGSPHKPLPIERWLLTGLWRNPDRRRPWYGIDARR